MSEISARVKARCGFCQKIDTHPKHHLNDTLHHLDCGREHDCVTCDTVLRASGNRHGESLTRFMESRVVETTGV